MWSAITIVIFALGFPEKIDLPVEDISGNSSRVELNKSVNQWYAKN